MRSPESSSPVRRGERWASRQDPSGDSISLRPTATAISTSARTWRSASRSSCPGRTATPSRSSGLLCSDALVAPPFPCRQHDAADADKGKRCGFRSTGRWRRKGGDLRERQLILRLPAVQIEEIEDSDTVVGPPARDAALPKRDQRSRLADVGRRFIFQLPDSRLNFVRGVAGQYPRSVLREDPLRWCR